MNFRFPSLSLADVSSSASEISRFEGKYLVGAALAADLRDYVRVHLQPDKHMPPDEPHGYRVLSLYLDSAQYELCKQTQEGVRQRYKLRIRFYDESADSLALLEIKSRLGDRIHKQRAPIRKSAAARLLSGEWLGPADLLEPNATSVRAMHQFMERRQQLQAEGTAFVCYRREAYSSKWPHDVRVTFDRELSAVDGRAARSLELTTPAVPVADGKVVLELKYSGRRSPWLQELVRVFQLERLSFPKYVHSVEALQLLPSSRGHWQGGAYG